MRNRSVFVTIAMLGSFGLLAFQNCSPVDFSGDQPASSPSATGFVPPGSEVGIPEDSFTDTPEGLAGGHFDLDTATRVYPLGSGSTNHHVHEYDDKFGVTYADFFDLADPKFDEIDEAIPAGKRFVLIVANAQLSKSGVVSVNGVQASIVDTQNKVREFASGTTTALPVFTLDGSSGQKLTSLRVGFPVNSILSGGLIGTETGCVRANDAGKLGEYRNGALVIQALDADLAKIDPVLGVATSDGGLLWESTIFYHWDGGCY